MKKINENNMKNEKDLTPKAVENKQEKFDPFLPMGPAKTKNKGERLRDKLKQRYIDNPNKDSSSIVDRANEALSKAIVEKSSATENSAQVESQAELWDKVWNTFLNSLGREKTLDLLKEHFILTRKGEAKQ